MTLFVVLFSFGLFFNFGGRPSLEGITSAACGARYNMDPQDLSYMYRTGRTLKETPGEYWTYAPEILQEWMLRYGIITLPEKIDESQFDLENDVMDIPSYSSNNKVQDVGEHSDIPTKDQLSNTQTTIINTTEVKTKEISN